MKNFEIYTDGSFDSSTKRCTSAYVVVMGDEVVFCGKLNIKDEKYLGSWNVSAELMAVVASLNCMGSIFGKEEQMTVTVMHDYVGVAQFIEGNPVWKAKKLVPQLYVAGIKAFRQNYPNIQLRFKKVKAHSGIHFNEVADALANERVLPECVGKMLRDMTL